MTVSGIARKGKSNTLCVLTLDDGSEHVLLYESVALLGVRKGDVLSGEELERLILHSDKLRAAASAATYAGSRLCSEFEVRKNLGRKGYSEDAQDYAVEKLKEYGFVSDGEFAKAFARSKVSSGGKTKIRHELRAKGVSDEHIQSAIGGIDDDELEANARRLAQKYMARKQRTQKDIQSLYRYLASRGYDYSLISQIVRDYSGQDGE